MPAKKHPRSRKKEQPHDAVFKAFFSDLEIARNYLLHYSPAAIHMLIDFSLFRKIDATFVSGRFGISFSDVLYETRLAAGAPARLLFLFEHKSYIPSLPVYLQLLDYMLQIWEDDIKNRRTFSIIIPIVVYHGEREWKQKPFSDYFLGLPEGWEAFIPNFHYLLTDLSQVPQQVIEDKRESEYLTNLFLALKFARNKRWIKENSKKITTFGESLYQDDRESLLLQTLVFYIIKVTKMTQTETKELTRQLPEPSRKIVEIAREIFGDEIPRFVMDGWKEKFDREVREEGREKGREEGREEGMEKGREDTTHTFTVKTIQKFPDWGDAEVAEFVGVTVKYVHGLRRELAKK